MSSGSLSRGDVVWLVGEILQADVQINAGSRDRYISGRRIALAATASRLLRVSRSDLDRYMKWVADEVATGRRIGELEEPFGWVRKNPA